MKTLQCPHNDRHMVEVAQGYYIDVCVVCAAKIFKHVKRAEITEKLMGRVANA